MPENLTSTEKKLRNLIPYKKGAEWKGNRKGRPRSFEQLRAAAQAIAHETVTDKNGEVFTITDAILRIWSRSKDLNAQKAFMEYAFGKVPDKIEGVQFKSSTVVVQYGSERTERREGPRLPAHLSQGAN